MFGKSTILMVFIFVGRLFAGPKGFDNSLQLGYTLLAPYQEDISEYYDDYPLRSGFNLVWESDLHYDCWSWSLGYLWFNNPDNIGLLSESYILEDGIPVWRNFFGRFHFTLGKIIFNGKHSSFQCFTGLLSLFDEEYFELSNEEDKVLRKSSLNWFGTGPYLETRNCYFFCLGGIVSSFVGTAGLSLPVCRSFLVTEKGDLSYRELTNKISPSLNLKLEYILSSCYGESYVGVSCGWLSQIYFQHSLNYGVLGGLYSLSGLVLSAEVGF